MRKVIKKFDTKTIFINGNIHTLNKKNEIVDSMVIKSGKIIKLGTMKEVLELQDKTSTIINLMNRTVIPAFIDTFGQLSSYAKTKQFINICDCINLAQIRTKLKTYIYDNQPSLSKFIIAYGYDINQLIENEHPTKEFLDTISDEYKILVMNKSCEMGVFNTQALNYFKIKDNSSEIQEGEIEIKNSECTGLISKNTFHSLCETLPEFSLNETMESFKKAQKDYFKYGICTCQDANLNKEGWKTLSTLASSKILRLDTVGYLSYDFNNFFDEQIKRFKSYSNRLKLGGFSISIDGTLQTRNAYLNAPYIDNEKYSQSESYKGFLIKNQDELYQIVQDVYNKKTQIIATCDGDQAFEIYLNSLKLLSENFKDDLLKFRPVVAHSLLTNQDQLFETKKYNIIPSFYTSHIKYWMNNHISNIGYNRAQNITPLNSAIKNHILFTMSQDAPNLEPNMIELIDIAVNRKSNDGEIFNHTESINVLDAVKALTVNAAFQYSEQDTKGTLEENKVADFVILSDDIFSIPKEEIKDVEVLFTVKNGRLVYKKYPTPVKSNEEKTFSEDLEAFMNS